MKKNVLPFIPRASARPTTSAHFRERGFYVPVDVDAIADDEESLRAWLVCTIWQTLFSSFNEFRLEHGKHFDEQDYTANFLQCYTSILRRFKVLRMPGRHGRARTAEDHARNYAVSIRLSVYDSIAETLKQLSSVDGARNESSYEFYVKFRDLSCWVGQLCERMGFVIDGRVNHAEFHILQSTARTRGGQSRHESDPKQDAKAAVYGWWKKWQAAPDMYKGKAWLARTMLDKYPILESQPVIEGWCREWAQGLNLPMRVRPGTALP